MLSACITRPSTSDFSSFVLVVKRRTEVLYFVNYKSFNKTTTEDRFPIPTIDELLDELHYSRLFTKLDLRSGNH